MIKGFRQIASFTFISRIFGLIRDMTFSRFLGASGLMDLWIIAFQIPNLSRRLFGEGAASASFIPIYRELLESDPEKANQFARTVVTVIFTLLSVIVLVGWLLLVIYRAIRSPNEDTILMTNLIATMLPYMIMICSVAILAGVLNVHSHFAAPACAPIILNIFIIGSVLTTGYLLKVPGTVKVFSTAVAVLIAGIVQLSVQLIVLRKKNILIRPAWQVRSEAFKKTILLMAPMIIGLTATQINTLADVWIARFFSGSELKGEYLTILGRHLKYPLWEGCVSHLYYSQRLYQFPLGVLGISLATAIFPVMSANAAKKDYSALTKSISKAVRAAVFISIPAIAGLIIVAKPLVRAIFQGGEFSPEDTNATSYVLIFYAIGLSGYFCQQLLTRAFYSLQDSKDPTKSALAAVIVNIILNLSLIWFMGTAGLALATALCSYLQVIFLLRILVKRFGNSILAQLPQTIIKTVISTVFMSTVALVVVFLLRNLSNSPKADILRLALIVPLSAVTYYIAAKILKEQMLNLIITQKPI